MSRLQRISALLFSSALVGCTTLQPPLSAKDRFLEIADGCGVVDAKTGQQTISLDCLAQKQLEAEARQKEESRRAELAATADITKAIIKQPKGKSTQAQDVAAALAALKLYNLSSESGLDDKELLKILPQGITPGMIRQLGRVTRSVLGGQCSYDSTQKFDLCFEPVERKPAPLTGPQR